MTNPTIIAVAGGSAQTAITNALTSVTDIVKKNPTIDWTSTLLDLLKDLSPVAQPEQLIYIYGYGFDSNGTQVRAAGITQLPNLRIKSQSVIFSLNMPIINVSLQIFEIQAYMPSLRQLQTSKYYAPNAILLWLQIEAINHDNISATFGFPTRLPPPVVDKCQKNYPLITMGTVSGGSERGDHTDHLGGPSASGDDSPGGQIRWYSYESIPNLINYDFSNEQVPTDLNKTNVVTLPGFVTNPLRAIRKSGTRLLDIAWHDDGIEFEVPSDPGVVIVWRDDIPSVPISFLDNLTQDLIQKFADMIWKWTSFDGWSPSVPYPLGLGQAIPLQISQFAADINNLLAKLIKLPGFSVKFGFIMDRDMAITKWDLNNVSYLGKNPVYTDFPELNLSNILNNAITNLVNVYYHPDPIQKGTATLYNKTFKIQLCANITLPGAKPVTIKLGPQVTFKPMPLEIPILAVFFADADFQGAPLFFLPSNTPVIGGGHWDDNNSSELGDAINKLRDYLDLANDAINVISWLWGSEKLFLIQKVIYELDAFAHPVIDATGEIDSLENAVIENHPAWWDEDFDDGISSLILIGIPYSLNQVTVNCYADEDETGTEVDFLMPDNTIVAAVHNFCNLTEKCTCLGKTIPLPFRSASDFPGFNDFNDTMSSVEIVQLGVLQQS